MNEALDSVDLYCQSKGRSGMLARCGLDCRSSTKVCKISATVRVVYLPTRFYGGLLQISGPKGGQSWVMPTKVVVAIDAIQGRCWIRCQPVHTLKSRILLV